MLKKIMLMLVVSTVSSSLFSVDRAPFTPLRLPAENIPGAPARPSAPSAEDYSAIYLSIAVTKFNNVLVSGVGKENFFYVYQAALHLLSQAQLAVLAEDASALALSGLAIKAAEACVNQSYIPTPFVHAYRELLLSSLDESLVRKLAF